MTWGKFFTQAAFAVILAIMALLPVTTYGCLKLRQMEKQDGAPVAPENRAEERSRS